MLLLMAAGTAAVAAPNLEAVVARALVASAQPPAAAPATRPPVTRLHHWPLLLPLLPLPPLLYAAPVLFP